MTVYCDDCGCDELYINGDIGTRAEMLQCTACYKELCVPCFSESYCDESEEHTHKA